MTTKIIAIICTVTVLLSSCDITKRATKKTLYISADTRICNAGEFQKECMLIKWSKDQKEWNNFSDNIDGFNYEKGNEYELLVSEIKVENPPADASDLKFKLVKIISQKKGEIASITQEHKYCKELIEVRVTNDFDFNKTNLSSLNFVFHSCMSKELVADIFHNETELKSYIQNEMKTCTEYFKDTTGKEYILNETIARIKKEVDFTTQNLIVLNANFGGPPFNTIDCKIENSKIIFNVIDNHNKNGISGMALNSEWKLFKVAKNIELQKQ